MGVSGLRSHAIAEVEKLAEEIAAEGVEATGNAHGEPAALAIVAGAERLPADLIVMGTTWPHWSQAPRRLGASPNASYGPRRVPCCTLTAEARTRWSEKAASLAAEGHKVIACATRHMRDHSWIGSEPARGLALVGLLAFEDPIREGVPEAIAPSLASGIRVVM